MEQMNGMFDNMLNMESDEDSVNSETENIIDNLQKEVEKESIKKQLKVQPNQF